MRPCARGCCWSPYSCALDRSCACHWDEKRPAPKNTGDSAAYSDPTANQAVRNVMKATRKGP